MRTHQLTELPLRWARPSAYFGAPVSDFARLSTDAILGHLATASQFDIELPQREAWLQEIAILQDALRDLPGYVYLEFDVPRLGSRIDAVLIAGPGVFPIEFKVGAKEYHKPDIDQAWDYGLDLKNFHLASHNAPILPILVATEARHSDADWKLPAPDGVRPPLCCNAATLGDALWHGLTLLDGPPLDGEPWGRAPYRPTPTIIQAAQALYARHSVEAISRNDAGARNLTITSQRVEEVVADARSAGEKAIVFVTGVPGAGKTLVGLNVATKRRGDTQDTHAVFLSGNGPLVAVLREALTRDELVRRKGLGERPRKGDVAQRVKPFIQNVHHFRDDGLRDESQAPLDHVVIFDEAQRAWNREKTSDFMRRRKGRAGFTQSEPEFLISYLDRHQDWAVILCLVGGGQEIHTGEAGIGAWIDAVRDHFPHWRVYISPQLTDSEYSALESIAALGQAATVRQDEALHLAVSMRSFRAEAVSGFVKALLDCDRLTARELLAQVTERYPLAITRDLALAKRWTRQHARGTERYGLVASSQAMRLKPHAVDVRVSVDPVQWFLNDASDTRSSWYLEDAATEFQIQGLELDWICMTWDADLRHSGDGWKHHSFRGDKWVRIIKPDRQRYLLNAYRVLLTRARQGMVVFVPPGDPADPTRDPSYYDRTWEYLAGLGIAHASA